MAHKISPVETTISTLLDELLQKINPIQYHWPAGTESFQPLDCMGFGSSPWQGPYKNHKDKEVSLLKMNPWPCVGSHHYWQEYILREKSKLAFHLQVWRSNQRYESDRCQLYNVLQEKHYIEDHELIYLSSYKELVYKIVNVADWEEDNSKL